MENFWSGVAFFLPMVALIGIVQTAVEKRRDKKKLTTFEEANKRASNY